MKSYKATDDKVLINIGVAHIYNSNQGKLFGIKIKFGFQTKFEDHIGCIYKKTVPSLMLRLTKASGDVNREKRRLIINSFILPQLSYCPLTWVFRQRIKPLKLKVK